MSEIIWPPGTRFKVWLEIEAVDEEGDSVAPDGVSGEYVIDLPFSATAECDTLESAVATAERIHSFFSSNIQTREEYNREYPPNGKKEN